MKENLFLITMKNPPVTHLVDDCSTQLKKVECMEFNQEGLRLIIPVNINCNIAYAREVTPEQAVEIERMANERAGQNKIVKPKFVMPKGKIN